MFKFLRIFNKWYWHLIALLAWGTIIGPFFATSNNVFLITLDIILMILLVVWTAKISLTKD